MASDYGVLLKYLHVINRIAWLFAQLETDLNLVACGWWPGVAVTRFI